VHLRVLSVFVAACMSQMSAASPLSIAHTPQANPSHDSQAVAMNVASSFGSVGCGVNRSASGVGGAGAGAGGD
jgi:hypothetical protein